MMMKIFHCREFSHSEDLDTFRDGQVESDCIAPTGCVRLRSCINRKSEHEKSLGLQHYTCYHVFCESVQRCFCCSWPLALRSPRGALRSLKNPPILNCRPCHKHAALQVKSLRTHNDLAIRWAFLRTVFANKMLHLLMVRIKEGSRWISSCLDMAAVRIRALLDQEKTSGEHSVRDFSSILRILKF